MDEQPALDRQRKAIPGMHETSEPTPLRDHSVTGDDEGERIRSAGLSHCSRRGSQFGGDITITSRLSGQYRGDRLPYPPAMRRPVETERQIETIVGIAKIRIELQTGFDQQPLGR
jgi:hypothetical protein